MKDSIRILVQSRRHNGYGHITASVVVHSNTRESDRGYKFPRYPDWSEEPASDLNLDGLKVTCQWNLERMFDSDNLRNPYAWRVEYDFPHQFVNNDFELANESEVKTLRTIARRMKAIAAKHGAPTSFETFVQYFAIAIGAECFIGLTASGQLWDSVYVIPMSEAPRVVKGMYEG